MKMDKSNRAAAAVFACILVLLAGCEWLMMRDFDKATEVATVNIGKAHTVTQSIYIPTGDTDLRFVLREYDCKHPLNATINIMVQLANGTVTQQNVKLSELAWPRSGRDQNCRPIGFLRMDDGKYTRPLSITIDRKSNPVKFTVKVTQVADSERQMAIWVVYNDREPVVRMLGKEYSGP